MHKTTPLAISVSIPVLGSLLGGLLAGGLASQNKTLCSPPGFIATESESGSAPYSPLLGGYPEQRFQLADGNLPATTLMLSRAELRRDVQPGFSSQDRSWPKLTLFVGQTDLASFGPNFQQNRVGPMSTVFVGAVTWSAPGGLSTKPAPWGTQGLDFPFSQPVAYSGQPGLLMEYVFEGGTLAGGQHWNDGSLQAYYLDGVSGEHHRTSQSTFFGSTNCSDSAHGNGGVQRFYLLSHAKNSPGTPDQYNHYQEAYNTAANAPVIQAIGVAGSSIGTPVGACNGLHVLPVITLPVLADVDGYSRLSLGTAPYESRFVGLSIWAQSAWTDSQNGSLQLTNAVRSTIVAQPQALGWTSYVTTTTNHTAPLLIAEGTFYGSTYVPLHRYTFK